MHAARQAKRDALRLWRLCLVHGRADRARVRVVVDGLTEARSARSAVLLMHLLRLLKLEEAKWSARVESAAPLAAGEREAVEEGLARRYGGTLATTFAVEPALIGGMRLTVGSDVYDGSIRARLARIATAL
jgi:F-type H+-transporting ATPase subunit delta